MSTSSHTHRAVHVAPDTPSGWFGIAVAATFTAAIVGALSWSELGFGWAAGILVTVVALGGTALASRRGRDAAVAFFGGTVVTIAGLYATLLVMAQFYAVAIQQ